MPSCNMNKKQKQSMRKNKRQAKRRSTKIQRGGVSNACVLGTAGTSVLQANGVANLHNINPQASLDLDNKFMAYGGPVPLGSNILQGGANRCGDDGVGTSNGKTETFKQYLNGLDKQLGSAIMRGGANQPNKDVVKQPSNNPPPPDNNNAGISMSADETEPIPNILNTIQPKNFSIKNSKNEGLSMLPNNTPEPSDESEIANEAGPNTTPGLGNAPMPEEPMNNTGQNGGGFTTDPSEYIAGLPVYKAYDDCCPPAIVNGQLKFGAPDQPACGLGAIKGGARKGKKNHSKKHSKKQHSKKHKKSRRTQRGGDWTSKTQRGGDWTSVGRSKPAMFDEAFNGPPSVFAYPEDFSKRAFGETQPNYTPNAI